MREPGGRRVAIDIDTALALIGAAAALVLTLWLVTSTSNRLYPIMTVLSLGACMAYLAAKRSALRSSTPILLKIGRERPSVCLSLSMIFFFLILAALLAIITRAELYSRPLTYFIYMALAAGVLAIEIFLLPPRKSYIYLALAEIILLSLVLIWTPQTTFPSLLGMDTFSHGELTSQTLVNGRLPPGERYSSFPIMHLTAGTTMLVANLDYKLATMVSLCVAYVVVVLLFVFLVGRLAASNRVGLTAALLLSLIPSYIHSGWWMAPNFYAPVFMLGIVYLLFQGKTRHPVRLTLLSIFLMTALIITHEIATLALAIALGFFWLAQKPYERIYRVEYRKFATLALCLFFGAAMFSWWKYTSPTTINTLQRLMHYHLSAELWYQPVEQSRQYMATIPFSEHLLRNLAEPLFYAISFIGCLAAFSWRWGNRHIFLLAITGLALLSIGFFSLTFEFGTLPNRWQFVSLFWLAIPAAIGLFLLGRGEGEDSRGCLLYTSPSPRD